MTLDAQELNSVFVEMCEEAHPDGTRNLYCVKPPGHDADNHGEKHASPIGYWPETDEWEWVEWED